MLKVTSVKAFIKEVIKIDLILGNKAKEKKDVKIRGRILEDKDKDPKIPGYS